MTQAKNQTEIPKKKKQDAQSDETVRELGDIRIPLFILFLAGVFLSRIVHMPGWIIFALASPLIGGFSFYKERKLLMALMSWKCIHTAAAPLIGIVLYGIFDSTLQLVADLSLKDGTLTLGKQLPLIFSWLLELKGQFANLNPVAVGLAGGIGVAFSEGVFWRGFVQTRMMIALGHGVAVIASALLYGIFYFLVMGPLAGLLALFCGIVFAILTLRARSLVPSMITHFVLLILALWIKPDFSAFF